MFRAVPGGPGLLHRLQVPGAPGSRARSLCRGRRRPRGQNPGRPALPLQARGARRRSEAAPRGLTCKAAASRRAVKPLQGHLGGGVRRRTRIWGPAAERGAMQTLVGEAREGVCDEGAGACETGHTRPWPELGTEGVRGRPPADPHASFINRELPARWPSPTWRLGSLRARPPRAPS